MEDYPVIATVPIESSTHEGFELRKFGKFGERLTIKKGRNRYTCRLKTAIKASPKAPADLSNIRDTVDTLCLALSITQDGVFSRQYRNPPTGLLNLKWCAEAPKELVGSGIRVIENKKFNHKLIKDAEYIFDKFTRTRENNPNAYSILIAYTVSCRFLNNGMIRESAINFFSVVETVATLVLPRKLKDKSTYQPQDLWKAATQLNLTLKYESLKNAYDLRGGLAHGHPKHILLMQHSLAEQEVTSWSLIKPALECKKVADSYIRGFAKIKTATGGCSPNK